MSGFVLQLGTAWKVVHWKGEGAPSAQSTAFQIAVFESVAILRGLPWLLVACVLLTVRTSPRYRPFLRFAAVIVTAVSLLLLGLVLAGFTARVLPNDVGSTRLLLDRAVETWPHALARAAMALGGVGLGGWIWLRSVDRDLPPSDQSRAKATDPALRISSRMRLCAATVLVLASWFGPVSTFVALGRDTTPEPVIRRCLVAALHGMFTPLLLLPILSVFACAPPPPVVIRLLAGARAAASAVAACIVTFADLDDIIDWPRLEAGIAVVTSIAVVLGLLHRPASSTVEDENESNPPAEGVDRSTSNVRAGVLAHRHRHSGPDAHVLGPVLLLVLLAVTADWLLSAITLARSAREYGYGFAAIAFDTSIIGRGTVTVALVALLLPVFQRTATAGRRGWYSSVVLGLSMTTLFATIVIAVFGLADLATRRLGSQLRPALERIAVNVGPQTLAAIAALLLLAEHRFRTDVEVDAAASTADGGPTPEAPLSA